MNSVVIIQLAAVVSNKVTGVAGEIMSRHVPVIHAIVISISVNLWRWNGMYTVLGSSIDRITFSNTSDASSRFT